MPHGTLWSMTQPPPDETDTGEAEDPLSVIEQQLDGLLERIEQVDQEDALLRDPPSAEALAEQQMLAQAQAPPPTPPTAAPAPEASKTPEASEPPEAPAAQPPAEQDPLAQISEAIDSIELSEPSEPTEPVAADDGNSQMLAALNQALDGLRPPTPPPAPDQPPAQAEEAPDAPAPAPAAEPAEPVAADDGNAQMLASLNQALDGLRPSTPPAQPVAQTPAPAAAPPPPEQPPVQPEPAPASDAQDSDKDIEAEIEALLAEQPIDPTVMAAAQEIAQKDKVQAQQDQEKLQQRAQDAAKSLGQDPAALSAKSPDTPQNTPSIDQIDQMLAEEIDNDDELTGDFQSVEDIAAGIIPTGEGEKIQLDDDSGQSREHARVDPPAGASASDVAAELDNQPENKLHETPAQGEQAQPIPKARRRINVKKLLHQGERAALHLCAAINWPARQFLSLEWRSTLGYIALLQVAGGVAMLIVGVIKSI